MASDYFLRIDGIPGESTDAKHKGEIELLSWSWGESNAGGGGGGGGAGRGKPSLSSFSYLANFSQASPLLMQACLTGQRIKSAVMSARRSGADGGAGDYLTFSMTNVLVESCQESADGEAPTESISLTYGSFHIQYHAQNGDGTLGSPVQAGWDLSKNTPA